MYVMHFSGRSALPRLRREHQGLPADVLQLLRAFLQVLLRQLHVQDEGRPRRQACGRLEVW